jgi:hypothetical protein
VTTTGGQLASAYQLPFAVRYTYGALGSGADLALEWEVLPDQRHDTEVMRECLAAFAGLAATGALGGGRVKADRSGFQLVVEGEQPRHALFKECRLDDGALVVLAHLLLARAGELNLAAIRLAELDRGARTVQVLAEPAEDATYPEPADPLPFELIDEEPESGALTFTAELAAEALPETEAALIEAAERWRIAVCGGGYALPPLSPEQSYVEPDAPIAFGRTLEWTMVKLRADDGAIHAAVNLFAALHVRAQRIVTLTIS